jgi:site-specific DNA recombinase
MKKALGYLRVSGKGQANDGYGLEDQKDAILKWAALMGYEIVEWFQDAISGERAWQDRPGMAALVQRVAINGIDAVVVHQLDRIARGKSPVFWDFLTVVETAGVAVIGVVDGLLTTDDKLDEFQNADREMILGIKMAIVRNEKRKLVARMALGKMRAKAEGKRTAGEYFYGTDPRKPEEKATLARMHELKQSGLTCYGIAKALDSEGLKPRKAAKWAPNAVQRILER